MGDIKQQEKNVRQIIMSGLLDLMQKIKIITFIMNQINLFN